MLHGLLVGPSSCAWHTYSYSAPNQTNSHLYILVQKKKKPQWKLHLHFYFSVWELPSGMIYLREYFIPQDYFLSSLQRLQRWQLWCWLLRCTYTVHWHCTKMINRLFTWVSLLGTDSFTINLSCVQIIHMGDKNLHILLPILQVTCSSISLNKVELGMSCGYWDFVGFFGFLSPPSLFKEEKKEEYEMLKLWCQQPLWADCLWSVSVPLHVIPCSKEYSVVISGWCCSTS